MNNTQNLVFFGLVGSGKGTQVELLRKYLEEIKKGEVAYMSSGVEYRKHIQSETFVGSVIRDSMARGELQPDFMTNSIFVNFLISNVAPQKHLLMDGYPRTLIQSECLEQAMNFFQRNDVKIIYIELSKEEAIKRMKLRGRADDNDEGIERRFWEYENNVLPAMNYFKEKQGYEIITVNGEQSIEAVHADILKALNLNN